jgi:hypothetical protein
LRGGLRERACKRDPAPSAPPLADQQAEQLPALAVFAIVVIVVVIFVGFIAHEVRQHQPAQAAPIPRTRDDQRLRKAARSPIIIVVVVIIIFVFVSGLAKQLCGQQFD